MSQTLKIAGACLNQTPIDWENNLFNIQSAIKEAKKEGVALLCLPELCITGYGCEDLFLSPWLPEKALEQLSKIIQWTDGISVNVGLPVIIGEKIYNTTCIISNRKILGFYAKQKLANDGVHYEERWFTAWESGQIEDFQFEGTSYPFGHISVEINNLNVGFEICEDAWREDRPAADYNHKVDLLLNPSASHFAFRKAKFREKLVIDSSSKFDCIYLYTNLLGNESGRMIYDGDILIADRGKLIARNKRLSYEAYKLLSVEVDFDSRESQEKIQPDFANQNEEFTQAASLALFDYLRKSKSKGFVLSLSGGADSSTIATLVSEVARRGLAELGSEVLSSKLNLDLKNLDQKGIVQFLLTTAYQATKNSSEDTFNSAKSLAESLGAKFYSWEIDKQVEIATQTIETAIGRSLTWDQDDITLQNIQARSRSPIVWMLANLNNALLLATSNRSEGDVGYATMDGDTSGSISPIAGVSKHFLLNWLQYAEKELGYSGLSYVNALTPTAELRPGEQHQTDEDDLMPYITLMQIEREAILNRKSPRQVFEALEPQYKASELKAWIQKYFSLWTRNQWKRERYAPSFHFDDFNIDPRSWCRFPILSGGFKEELEEL